MYLSYNGSSNYGTMVRENLSLNQDIGTGKDNLEKAGAYARYGYYYNKKWNKLKSEYGNTTGSLGGTDLYRNVKAENTHLNKAYETAVAYTSSTGKQDHVATFTVFAAKARKDYRFQLTFSKFSTGTSQNIFSGSTTKETNMTTERTINLGTAGESHPFSVSGGINEEIFDAVIDMAAGDFDGDGVDEIALTYGTGNVMIYNTRTGNVKKTISASDIESRNFGKSGSVEKCGVISLAAGDLKKDYSDDLAIGVSAPFYSNDGKNEDGAWNQHNKVYIYGNDGEAGISNFKCDETIDLNKPKNDSRTMRSIGVGIGDLNGNGRDQLVIGGWLTSLNKYPIGSTYYDTRSYYSDLGEMEKILNQEHVETPAQHFSRIYPESRKFSHTSPKASCEYYTVPNYPQAAAVYRRECQL